MGVCIWLRIIFSLLDWSFNLGVFICIKCSGVHRSLGVHISKVLSVKLDEWTEEQVNTLIDGGGNSTVNMRYEAFIPKNISKPGPDSSTEERSDFIRRKYDLLQFLGPSSDHDHAQEETNQAKHRVGVRQAFRHSWRRKEAKSFSTRGMVEFVGMIKVNIFRGTNLAIRDVVSSDPYVVLTLGHQLPLTGHINSQGYASTRPACCNPINITITINLRQGWLHGPQPGGPTAGLGELPELGTSEEVGGLGDGNEEPLDHGGGGVKGALVIRLDDDVRVFFVLGPRVFPPTAPATKLDPGPSFPLKLLLSSPLGPN
ncbi:putative ADP-ribosylation factor GTPase-activating protein AGD11 isoform X2 [Wolffia australiana]